MKKDSLAVLLTCFNRKSKTLDCLKAILSQQSIENIDLSVYLVDDGSTDGTAAAVNKVFPQVHIIKGNGHLFWNGGMRLAFSEASKSTFDFYLWINDDTKLYENAISQLFATFTQLKQQGFDSSIIAGSTQDPDTGALTYGGVNQGPWWQPLKFASQPPQARPIACDTMNGNCVLIPKKAFEKVGNLDPSFEHDLGDYDYGLRAKAQACQVWALPGYVGTCPANPHSSRADSTIQEFSEALSKTNNPKGLAFNDVTLHPFKEWKIFSSRHGGVLWPIFYLLPYRRLLPSLLSNRKH